RKIYYKDRVSSPKADYHANSAQVFSELAYDVKLDQINIEPYLGLSYTRLDVAKISEEKELFSLSGKREAKDIYAGTLGARINYSIQYTDNLSVNFQTGAGLKHTFSDLSSNTDMSFRSHGNDFSVAGLPLKRNVVQLNAKVALQTKGGLSVGLDYQAEKASGMRDQSVSAYGSWEF
ncbi:autotransporter outer membrane beta-barrel domain-containing protein, partial [Pseudomonas sp. PA-4-8C]